MVLKQPKKDKRTDTCKGTGILNNVLVLLLFLSKDNNYFIKGKVKKTLCLILKNVSCENGCT